MHLAQQSFAVMVHGGFGGRISWPMKSWSATEQRGSGAAADALPTIDRTSASISDSIGTSLGSFQPEG
eukprot:SAG11_NODE_1228_length_5473_cov_3.015445_5_plen_68_part_00